MPLIVLSLLVLLLNLSVTLGLEVSSFRGDHESLGVYVGQTFKSNILLRLQRESDLISELKKEFSPSGGEGGGPGPGASTLTDFLTIHNETFPDYMAEIKGMSAGSGGLFVALDFSDVSQKI